VYITVCFAMHRSGLTTKLITLKLSCLLVRNHALTGLWNHVQHAHGDIKYTVKLLRPC
jgi:hypothetical protein